MHPPFLSSCARILAARPGSEQIPLPMKCPASPARGAPEIQDAYYTVTFPSWPLDTQHCPAVLHFMHACIRPSVRPATHLSTQPIFSRHLPCARRCSETSLVQFSLPILQDDGFPPSAPPPSPWAISPGLVASDTILGTGTPCPGLSPTLRVPTLNTISTGESNRQCASQIGTPAPP